MVQCMRILLMGWLWLVGSIQLWVSFAKKPYKIDNILQKRPIIQSILLTIATPWHDPHRVYPYIYTMWGDACIHMM